jgi:flagella basal body P-ring formation protein FlgA
MKISMSMLALTLAGTAAPAIAQQGFADPAQIDREVAAFLGVPPSSAGSEFTPVDRRMRLASCAQPHALDWQGTRRDSVLVQCPGVWKIYVRTAAQPGVAAPGAVKRGQPVSVSVRGSGFSVSQNAQALEDGAIGDWVRIRIGKSGEMQARVIRPGAVSIDL